ncbi:MAG: GNAT family N-acetyltransferase [Chloroflexota bacterium]
MEEKSNDLIHFIEGVAANAWRPAVEQQLAGWRLRFSGGSSRRVNSVWPNQLTGELSLEERIDLVEDFYRRHGQPACFQMCAAALPENLADALKARGYQDLKPTSVRTAPVEAVIANSTAPKTEVTQTSKLTDEWFQAYTTASEYRAESLPIRRGILSRIGPAANFFVLRADDQPAAVGLGVVERGWLGVFCVVTFSAYRRQKFASQVTHGLTTWGIEAGASQVYLQVMDNNSPALAMYQKLGFEKLYAYWYSKKGLE